MEKTDVKPPKEKQVVTLDQIRVNQLPELQGWKEKQQAIVKKNPFVAIQDNKSYEDAKKHRTALVSARTDIQKQDKLIASKLKELRTQAANVAQELIAITQPHEEKQQEEVKRYEAEKEAERLEKERLERERKEKIQSRINNLYQDWKSAISQTTYDSIESMEKELEAALDAQSQQEMEEFEMDFAEKTNLLRSQLEERVQYLNEKEEARKEAEKLAKERAELERLKKEAEEQKAKEEAERKQREEAERDAREAEERKIREEREAEARELARQRDELEAEKKRLAKQEEKRQAKIEAERKSKEEAEARAKAEKEEAERKAAEEKRMEALKPDKEQLASVIDAIGIHREAPALKDQAAQVFYTELKMDIEHLKKHLKTKLSQIK